MSDTITTTTTSTTTSPFVETSCDDNNRIQVGSSTSTATAGTIVNRRRLVRSEGNSLCSRKQQSSPPSSMSGDSTSRSSRRSNNSLVLMCSWGCQVTAWIALVAGAYHFAWRYYLAGVNIPDVEWDRKTGQQRVRRKPELLQKQHPLTGEVEPTSEIDAILEGRFTLIGIVVPTNGLTRNGDAMYSDVSATFCHIAWKVQEDDPSSVPMFADLQYKSPLCDGTRITVDLWNTTRMARSYDLKNYTFAATRQKSGHIVVPPTAVIFHQTRTGSTLMSNMLAAFEPKHARVYSESTPPVMALTACDNSMAALSRTTVRCDAGSQSALIQDVFYMMGRTADASRPQYTFYKIQSAGTMAIQEFAEAMPRTPWIFAYRNGVEILMSHFSHYQVKPPQDQQQQISFAMPNCLRYYRLPAEMQPPLLEEMVAARGLTMPELTPEEYCAAQLASLAEAVIEEDSRTYKDPNYTKRWFVNYETLPHVMWETILPEILDHPLSQEQIRRMHTAGSVYSKGRGKFNGERFHEDSTLKRAMAPDSVKEAAQLFMDPLYTKMERLRMKIKDGHHD